MDQPTMTKLDDANGTSARTGTDPQSGACSGATGVDDTGENPSAEEALHASRTTLYGAVGGAFCYPDEELRTTLTDDDARDGVLQAAERLGLSNEAEAFLDGVADASVSDLEAAYNAMFGLPDGGEYPVIPYEAHYTTDSDVGESQRRIATVVGLMETFGVVPGEEFAERHDHVAAELELMQVVSAQHAVAIHEGDATAADRLDDAEATILDHHLVEFVPAFAHDVAQTVEGDRTAGWRAYRAAANLAAELVRRDHADGPLVDSESDAESGSATDDAAPAPGEAAETSEEVRRDGE